MKPIKVAMVVPEYRTEAAPGGGVSAVADFLYSAFAADPHIEVAVFSPRMWSRAQENQQLLKPKAWLRKPSIRRGLVNGVEVNYVGSYMAEFEPMRYLPRPLLKAELSKCDVILVVSGSPAIINSLRGVDVPIVAQVATTVKLERRRLISQGSFLIRFYRRLLTQIVYRIDIKAIRIPDLVLVENSWMMDWCIGFGAADVALEIPGIDTDFFSPSMNLEPRGAGGYIISVGRLGDPRKDFGLLVRAYSEACRRFAIKQSLVIAGRGELPEEVLREISDSEFSDRIEVKKDVELEDLRDAYRNADFFAMSSSEEGLGIVLLEAMACGAPVVSTATEGAKSVVGAAGVGTLVDLDDDLENNLAQEIAKLANDPRRMIFEGKICREAAELRFGSKGASERFRRAVRSVLPSSGVNPVEG